MLVHGPPELVERCTTYLSIGAPPLLAGVNQVSLTLAFAAVASGDCGALAAIAATITGWAIAAGGAVVAGAVVVVAIVAGGVVVDVAIAAGGVVVDGDAIV